MKPSTIALLALTLDWVTKGAVVLLDPSRVVLDNQPQPVLSLLALIATGLLLYQLTRSRGVGVLLGVMVGAGAGNLLERVLTGNVVNFIPLPYPRGSYDLADLMLVGCVVGLGFWFLWVLWSRLREANGAASASLEAAGERSWR